MKFILAIIRLFPLIVYNYFSWINKCSKNPDKVPLEVRYRKLRKLLTKTIKIFKLDVKANNLEYLTNNDKPVLILCNHRFFLDPIFFIYLSEKPVSFIAKKELKDVPVLGKTIKAMEGFFIERDDLMSQVRLFKAVSEKLKRGNISYLIFPEGTRMKDKERIHTLPYKDGSIKVAYWAGVDILPSCMIGNEKTLDKMDKNYKKINVTLTFFKPYKMSEIKDIPTTKITPEIYDMTNAELTKLYQENLIRNKR